MLRRGLAPCAVNLPPPPATHTAAAAVPGALALLDAMPGHAAIVDAAGEIVAVNAAWRAFAQHHGLGEAQAGAGCNYLRVCALALAPSAANLSAMANGLRAVLAEETALFTLDCPCLVADAQRWFRTTVTAVQLPTGVGALVMHTDVTVQVRTDISSAEVEARYRAAFMGSALPMWVYESRSLRFLAVNAATVRHYGYTEDQFLAMTLPDLHPVHDRATLLERLAHVGPGPRQALWLHRCSDGREIQVDLHSDPVPWDGAPARLVTAQDITERVATEQAQRATLERLKLLETAVARLNDIVLITEAEPIDGPGPRIVFVNEAFERRTGWKREEVIGRTPRLLQGPATQRAELDRIRRAMQAWEPVRAELINYTKDGQPFWVELDIVPLADERGWHTHWVAIERDITERKEVEQQLQQSQRLESLGQLTGGVAHDFNNLLTVMLGNAELLAEQLPEGTLHRRLAQMIGAAAQRGAQLTQRLLAFARKQALEPRAVDLNRLIADLEPMLRRTLGAHIEVSHRAQPGLWPTLVDPTQLENALLNLAINAADAMPGGGRLRIETGHAELEAGHTLGQDGLEPGAYVTLTVTDTGSGIPAALLQRVFEPFFTTKERGKGTGLGLAMVYGFVKQSRGHVTIHSEPGGVAPGTTVRIYLPRHGSAVAAEAAEAAEVETLAAPEGTGQHVLLVEDDPLVRDYARSQLQALGYVVLQAADGPEALVLLRGTARVDLLFTDVVMPGGMNGRQLAEAAFALRPGLPVLYASGYNANVLTRNGRLDEGVLLLGKPYRRADLARKLHEALYPEAPGASP